MANYNLAELRGAVRVLESIIEVAEEEGDSSVPLFGLKDLLAKYKKQLKNPQS